MRRSTAVVVVCAAMILSVFILIGFLAYTRSSDSRQARIAALEAALQQYENRSTETYRLPPAPFHKDDARNWIEEQVRLQMEWYNTFNELHALKGDGQHIPLDDAEKRYRVELKTQNPELFKAAGE